MARVGENKQELLRGTLDLMVLQTLATLGPLHGYGIARRLEQVSRDLLAVNQGTLCPALLRLEQRGCIGSAWGASENNRRARFYSITARGRRQLAAATKEWEQTAALMARLLAGGDHA
ncbi:MAG: PadR family transcriptional regulator [Gemmataceae bacterium]